MTPDLETRTLIARRLLSLIDDLEVFGHMLSAVEYKRGDADRTNVRDVRDACACLIMAHADLADAIAYEATALDGAMARHPAGKHTDDETPEPERHQPQCGFRARHAGEWHECTRPLGHDGGHIAVEPLHGVTHVE